MKAIIKVLNARVKLIFAYVLYFVLMRLNDALIAIESLIKKPVKAQNLFLSYDSEQIIDFNKAKLSKKIKYQKISCKTFDVPPDKSLKSIESISTQSAEKVENIQLTSFFLK